MVDHPHKSLKPFESKTLFWVRATLILGVATLGTLGWQLHMMQTDSQNNFNKANGAYVWVEMPAIHVESDKVTADVSLLNVGSVIAVASARARILIKEKVVSEIARRFKEEGDKESALASQDVEGFAQIVLPSNPLVPFPVNAPQQISLLKIWRKSILDESRWRSTEEFTTTPPVCPEPFTKVFFAFIFSVTRKRYLSVQTILRNQTESAA